jgi:hypothetical protein
MQSAKASARKVVVIQLVKDPSTYAGTVVTFTGKIMNFLQDSVGMTTAMTVSDPHRAMSAIYVELWPDIDLVPLNKGDTVIIWGQAEGSVSGTGAFGTFGATIDGPAVLDMYLSDITTGYVYDVGS